MPDVTTTTAHGKDSKSMTGTMILDSDEGTEVCVASMRGWFDVCIIVITMVGWWVFLEDLLRPHFSAFLEIHIIGKESMSWGKAGFALSSSCTICFLLDIQTRYHRFDFDHGVRQEQILS